MPFGPIDGDQEGSGSCPKKRASGESFLDHLTGVMQEAVETGQGAVELSASGLGHKAGDRNGGSLSHQAIPWITNVIILIWDFRKGLSICPMTFRLSGGGFIGVSPSLSPYRSLPQSPPSYGRVAERYDNFRLALPTVGLLDIMKSSADGFALLLERKEGIGTLRVGARCPFNLTLRNWRITEPRLISSIRAIGT